MKKALVILVAVAFLAALGWKIRREMSGKPEDGMRKAMRPVPVAVEPVRRQTVRNVAEFTGSLLPRAQFVVAPKVQGRLEQLRVNMGDSVTNGQLVAVLDGAEYAQLVAQAKADLEVSRATLAERRSALAMARREYERARQLREQKVTSDAQLDEAEARWKAAQAVLDVAEAQIRRNEAALKAAEIRLSYTLVSAAWEDGEGNARKIAERFVDEGALLKPNDAIVSVVDLSVVKAEVFVIERDFPLVAVGQDAAIATDAYPGRSFPGRIARRAPVLREESRQARIEIEVPNPDGMLAPGMFVKVFVKLEEHAGATVVPASAVVKRGGVAGVFQPAGSTARFVPVRPGIVEGACVEIESPPLEGSVITIGNHLLEDGMAVALPAVSGNQAGSGTPGTARP